VPVQCGGFLYWLQRADGLKLKSRMPLKELAGPYGGQRPGGSKEFIIERLGNGSTP
jgi:hypothetical protein